MAFIEESVGRFYGEVESFGIDKEAGIEEAVLPNGVGEVYCFVEIFGID